MEAREFMDSDLVVVRPDDPVQDAVALMVEGGRLALPVVDEGGGVVGLVRQVDVLRMLLPDYLSNLPDLGFIPDDLPTGADTFEEVCQARVSEVIDPAALQVVDADEPIVEVVRLIAKQCLSDVMVVSEGRLVGTISSTALLQRLRVCGSEGSAP